MNSECLISVLLLAAKAIGVLVACIMPYIFYNRIYCYYEAKAFYMNQGARLMPGSVPVLGNLVQIIETEKALIAAKDNTFPLALLTD